MHKVKYRALRGEKKVEGIFCYEGNGCWRDASRALRRKLQNEGAIVAWVDANRTHEKCKESEWELKGEEK